VVCHSYVLLVASSTFLVNGYHIWLVGAARKPSGIKYPNAYATPEEAAKNPAAFKLNCAQRAHSNFLEQLTTTLATLLISGLKFPLTAAGIGAVWSLGRVIYARGYVKNGPEGRRRYVYPIRYFPSLNLLLSVVFSPLVLLRTPMKVD